MSKHKHDPHPQSEMTVMVFQFKGNDATLQEGLKTISATLSRALPGTHRPQLAILPQSSSVLDVPADESAEDASEPEDLPIPTTPGNGRPKRSSNFKAPSILDIDLRGERPLADFLKKYATEQVKRRYLLVAYWLKSERSLDGVTPDHIHTCFRHMSWQTPKNAAQPLRDMKSKNQWFSYSESAGTYNINHIGENEVLKMMEGSTE